MGFGGIAMRGSATIVRAVQFLASIVILGLFGYVLAYLHTHKLATYTWVRAVEGMAGASALYTLIAVILTCFLGGIKGFVLIAIVLDVCFAICYIAIIVLTRGGTANCNNIQGSSYDLGYGAGISDTNQTGSYKQPTTKELQRICKIEKAVFVIAIIQLILFVVSAIMQWGLGRHHQHEKKHAAANGPVSAGKKRRFPWQRKKLAATEAENGYVKGGH